MKELQIKSQKDYDRLKKIIKLFQKQETAENYQRHKNIINSNQEILCVSMANVRMIAKAIFKSGYETFLKIAKTKSKEEEFYEETLIQGIVIASIKDLDKQMEEFSWWVHKIDNWGTCDSTVTTMKGLKKSKNKGKYFELFYDMCFSEKEFVSRFGIIVLMTCYLENEYIDRLLKMAENVSNEAYYVQMGIAWMLSFCFMKFRDKTLNLLNKKILSKFVQNKTISKCRDSFQVLEEDKELLAELRIK